MIEYRYHPDPVPLHRANERELGPFYRGPVFVWDIDKTYLETRFSQLKGLLRIPFELGVDKRSIAGTVPLLKGLRDGPDGGEHRPVYFISASPFQIHRVLERKMLLDGVEFDGITFKDPLRALMRGRFGHLKEQVSFKLAALLHLSAEMPDGVRMHLFGDDAEQDALIYSLFGDVVAGRIRGMDLSILLARLGVAERYVDSLVQFVEEFPARDLVERLYIHLIRRPDGASITEFGPHVIGCPTMTAASVALADAGLIGDRTADSVLQEAGVSKPVAGGRDALPEGRLTPLVKQ
jgi:hypothetical protein